MWTLHPTSQHLSQSFLCGTTSNRWQNRKALRILVSVVKTSGLALLVCDFDLDFFFRDRERERLSWCLPGNCGAKNQLWRRKNDFDQVNNFAVSCVSVSIHLLMWSVPFCFWMDYNPSQDIAYTFLFFVFPFWTGQAPFLPDVEATSAQFQIDVDLYRLRPLQHRSASSHWFNASLCQMPTIHVGRRQDDKWSQMINVCWGLLMYKIISVKQKRLGILRKSYSSMQPPQYITKGDV